MLLKNIEFRVYWPFFQANKERHVIDDKPNEVFLVDGENKIALLKIDFSFERLKSEQLELQFPFLVE